MKARLEYIQSGAYKTVFDHPAVLFAYVTAGRVPCALADQSKNDGHLDTIGVNPAWLSGVGRDLSVCRDLI